MGICAYNENYFENARTTLAVAVDYAVNFCGENIDSFFQKFIESGVAAEFEKGAPAVTVGVSGVELYSMIVKDYDKPLKTYESFERSPEYWLGWSLAYFQYVENRSFKEIFSVSKPSEMILWYKTMHEEDVTSFVNALNEKMQARKTSLKILREQRGISQEQLADLSGVSLYSIRAYEQRSNDIRNAQYNVLFSLAKALKCNIDDIVNETVEPTKK